MGVDVRATCGMSVFSDEAFIKATVEWIERLAVQESLNQFAFLNRTSDGFAAYPKLLSLRNSFHAREKAMNEAIERYAWMEWWTNPNVQMDVSNASKEIGLAFSKNSLLDPKYPIERAWLLKPSIRNRRETLGILLCKIEGWGYVTGGAFGFHFFERALGELMRHYLGFTQHREIKINDAYNRRLNFFASGEGNDLVLRRLRSGGLVAIDLPPVEFDQEIPHQFSSVVHVHRCLFKGQAEFVDDRENVLCL